MSNLPDSIITDINGRPIIVRMLKPSEQFKLTKIVGKQGDNPAYVGMAMLAASVRMVDSIPVPDPTTENDISRIFDTLDVAGWDAVQSFYSKTATGQAVEEVMESAKN